MPSLGAWLEIPGNMSHAHPFPGRHEPGSDRSSQSRIRYSLPPSTLLRPSIQSHQLSYGPTSLIQQKQLFYSRRESSRADPSHATPPSWSGSERSPLLDEFRLSPHPTTAKKSRHIASSDTAKAPDDFHLSLFTTPCQSLVSQKHSVSTRSSIRSDPLPCPRFNSNWNLYADNLVHPKRMRLRELALNSKSPPSSTKSPISKNMKGRSKRNLNLRSTSFEASKYIEHLESELQAAQNQMQALSSPSTSKTHIAHLRQLEADNEVLRREISSWEEKFFDRVNVELEDRVELEGGLRAKIKFLEKERESKIARITELEDRIELEGGLRAKITFLEKDRDNKDTKIADFEERFVSFKNEIQTLNYENERLVQQLAQAPFTLRSSPATPGSMTENDENTPYQGSFINSRQSSSSTTGHFDILSDSSAPTPSSFAIDNSYQSRRYPHKENRFSGGVESPSQSLWGGSRPSSVGFSGACSSPTTTEGGFNAAAGIRSKVPSVKRRMRRFSAGSSGPKALILPTAQSADGISSPENVEKPWDETTPRKRDSRHGVKALDRGRPMSEITGNSGRKRSSWADEQTLKILESNASSAPVNEVRKRHSQQERFRTSWAPSASSKARDTSRANTRSRPQSLYAELSNVQEGVANTWGSSTPKTNGEVTTDDDYTPTNKARRVSLSQSGPRRQKPSHNRSRSEVVRSTYGNLRNAIRETWHDPSSLARRVVLNAWAIGPKSEGIRATGWWLLGLLIGQEKSLDKRRTHGQFEELFEDDMGVEASHRRWMEFIAERFDVTGSTDNPYVDGLSASQTAAFCEACAPDDEDGLWPWAKFSAALILALSIAIRDGPSVLINTSAANEGDDPKPSGSKGSMKREASSLSP